MSNLDARTRWLALYVLCLASLMIVLDVTIVGVALPFNSPELVSFKGLDGPIRADGSQRVERIGEGSRVSFEMEMHGHGLGSLLLPLARRQATRQVAESHQKLKRILESSGA